MCLISGTLLSTPLPWLPVLANIEPPALRKKATTDKLMEKIIAHDIWPIHSDITNPRMLVFHPGSLCGKTWYVWTWEVNGKKTGSPLRCSTFLNIQVVDDAIIRPPGFSLPRQHGF